MVLLCSPVLVPQMVGGLMPPPPLVTEKVSVKHWVATPTFWVPAASITPPLSVVTEDVDVEGPAMVKLTKSSLI